VNGSEARDTSARFSGPSSVGKHWVGQPVGSENSVGGGDQGVPARWIRLRCGLAMGQFDRFRSELWSFTYLAVRRVLSIVVLAFRRSGSKEIEILVGRYELEILRRK